MLLREFWNGRFWPYCTANLRESTCVGYESAWRLHVAPEVRRNADGIDKR